MEASKVAATPSEEAPNQDLLADDQHDVGHLEIKQVNVDNAVIGDIKEKRLDFSLGDANTNETS